jgi:RNAse (barnase) inhibitor barstar
MGTKVSEDSDRCPSGVYLIGAAERERVLRQDVFPSEFAVAVLDGHEAGTRAGFFRVMARALRFRDYFGHNWDAVYDCLTDLNWLPAAGYLLVLDRFDQFAKNEPRQWDIGLKVLRAACDFWQRLQRPMYTLLYGPGELAAGVSPLPPDCQPSRFGAPLS